MPSSPRRRERLAGGLVAAAVLAASVAYIAATFRWREALAILAHADPAWFFLGSGAAILVYWALRALRWQLLLRGMATHAPFADLYLSSSVALSLSVLTPLQSGEALKVELLRRQGHVQRLPGYTAFAVERVADLYVIAAIGAASLVGTNAGSLALAAATFLALPLVAFAAVHRIRLAGRAGDFVRHLQEGVSSVGALFTLLLITAAGWLAVAFGWHSALRSIAVALDLRQTLALLSLITLASIASLIPGGLGIAEAGTAELLRRFGIDDALAQAGALALRAFSLLVIALGLAHALALRWRTPRPGAER